MSYDLAHLQHTAHYVVAALRYESGELLTASNKKYYASLLTTCLSVMAKADPLTIVLDPKAHAPELVPFFSEIKESKIHFPTQSVFMLKNTGHSYEKSYYHARKDASEIEIFLQYYLSCCTKYGRELDKDSIDALVKIFEPTLQSLMPSDKSVSFEISPTNKKCRGFFDTLLKMNIQYPSHIDFIIKPGKRFYSKTHFFDFHDARRLSQRAIFYRECRTLREQQTKAEAVTLLQQKELDHKIAQGRSRSKSIGAKTDSQKRSDLSLHSDCSLPSSASFSDGPSRTHSFEEDNFDELAFTLSRILTLDDEQDVGGSIGPNLNHLVEPPNPPHVLTAQELKKAQKKRDKMRRECRDEKYGIGSDIRLG